MTPYLEPVVEELLAVAVHPGIELLFELVARHPDPGGWLPRPHGHHQLAVVLLPLSPLPIVELLRQGFRIHWTFLAPLGRPKNTGRRF